MDAEKQKTDSHADHHRKADIFSAAELKVGWVWWRVASAPYLDINLICAVCVYERWHV